MKPFLRIAKKIFCLPPVPTIWIALFGYSFVLAVAVFNISIPALQYLSYISSAYALVVTVTGFPHFLAWIKTVRQQIYEYGLMKKLQGTAVGERFFRDVRFRTEVSLYLSFFINLLYIGVKLFSGICYRSVWFISLAVYYGLLAMMRVVLLRRGKRETDTLSMKTELLRCRTCGIMLLIMNQALAGIVIFMVRQNRGFHYPGVLIYAMAAYSFYSVITATIQWIKFRKHGSPVLSAAKAINLVAALVSILSLETAMLAEFGGQEDPFFRKAMIGATGGGVCTIVIGMAVFMIWNATRQLKQSKFNHSQT